MDVLAYTNRFLFAVYFFLISLFMLTLVTVIMCDFQQSSHPDFLFTPNLLQAGKGTDNQAYQWLDKLDYLLLPNLAADI